MGPLDILTSWIHLDFMDLSDESVNEFIEIWKKMAGETLSHKDAQFHASRFLDLCLLLMEPLPSEDLPERSSEISASDRAALRLRDSRRP
jgi:hypothetical protein